jgi:hypothetical protein
MQMDLQQNDRVFEEKQRRIQHKKRLELLSYRSERTRTVALLISFKNATDDIYTN